MHTISSPWQAELFRDGPGFVLLVYSADMKIGLRLRHASLVPTLETLKHALCTGENFVLQHTAKNISHASVGAIPVARFIHSPTRKIYTVHVGLFADM